MPPVPPSGGGGGRNTLMITEAIILAGGLGTRLQHVVKDVPKCMAPVNGIPFIAYVIDHLQRQGIERFIFSLGYKSEQVIDFVDVQYKKLDKVFIIEPEQLGTGGAIREACNDVKNDHVVILNGDTLFRIDVQELTDIHTKQKAACTLALKPMKKFDRYGIVQTAVNGIVTGFREKLFCEEGLINGGVYALQVKHFLNNSSPGIFSFEKEYLEKNIHSNKLYGFAFDDYFIDIGIPEDYEKAQRDAVNWLIS